MSDRGKCQVCGKLCESRCSWCRLVFYCSKEHQKGDWEAHKATCSRKKYHIENDAENSSGHLVASEDIKADTILLKDRPILLSIKANCLEFTPNKICLGCYKEITPDESSSESDDDESESDSSDGENPTAAPKTCLKCAMPMCTSECSQHWFHKAFECRLISEAVVKAPPPSKNKDSPEPDKKGEASGSAPAEEPSVQEIVLKNLMYFRTILLKWAHPPSWETMMTTLTSDDEGRRDVPNLERTGRIWTLLKSTLGRINHPTINHIAKPDVHRIIGILDINAVHFNISSSEMELSALFPTFSQIRHSCIPNVRFYLLPTATSEEEKEKGGKKGKSNKYPYELYCRSAVKIKGGEALSVSHVNLMWNTEKRQEFLKKERGLWCSCPRCQDPTELGSNFSTIICSSEGCSGFAVPVLKSGGSCTSGGGNETHWKCAKCQKFTPPYHYKKIDSKLCEMVGRTKANLESYKELLTKMDEFVHCDYYLRFVLNHSLVQMYGQYEGEEEDVSKIQDPKMLEDKVALCNRLLQLIKKIDPGLAKLNLYTAVIYYEMQSAILAMAGGEVDDDFKTLRHKPETVKLARLYLLKCLDCFKYEFLDLPENKLRKLANKKLEYLDFILTKLHKTRQL